MWRRITAPERREEGGRKAGLAAFVFGTAVSVLVVAFAGEMMRIFTTDAEIIRIGISYLRIEGAFYGLIGLLFLCYGYFRAVEQPMVSVILTVISLGSRVILAYVLSGIGAVGYRGIWLSIPIGWALADAAGLYFLKKGKKER